MAKRRRVVDELREVRRALGISEDAESAEVRRALLEFADRDAATKLSWRGRVTSVQPRIRLTRSFDESSHTYLGFALRVEGRVGGQDNLEFWIGIGKGSVPVLVEKSRVGVTSLLPSNYSPEVGEGGLRRGAEYHDRG